MKFIKHILISELSDKQDLLYGQKLVGIRITLTYISLSPSHIHVMYLHVEQVQLKTMPLDHVAALHIYRHCSDWSCDQESHGCSHSAGCSHSFGCGHYVGCSHSFGCGYYVGCNHLVGCGRCNR